MAGKRVLLTLNPQICEELKQKSKDNLMTLQEYISDILRKDILASKPKKRSKAFLLFIFLTLVVSTVNAAIIDQEIEEKLQTEDEVSVIVILKDQSIQQKRLFQASKKEILKQRLEEKKEMIKNQQEKVLSGLNLKEKKSFGIFTVKQDLKLKHQYSTVNGFSGKLTKKGLEKLKNDPNVESIHINKLMHITLDNSIPQINADDTWKLQLNSTNITGAGETICILDTGIDYNHSSLGGGWGNKVIGGYDFINTNADPMDDNGHGTHVAGIAASNDSTYTGVAPDAKLIAIKVLNSGGVGDEAGVMAGIDWCVNNASAYNISVISMSLGDKTAHNAYCNNDPLAPSINAAVGQGIIVTISTGNCEGVSCTSGISAPACVENATAIGSVTHSNAIRYQRGALFEILAPGGGGSDYIRSTKLNGGFTDKHGTSMAAPHAAGAAALLQQFNKLQNGISLTPAQIRQALNDTGVLIDDSANSGYNFSRIDVYAAVQSLDTIPPNNVTFVNPTPENNTSTFNTSIIINVTVEDYLNNISSCLLEWNSSNESITKDGSGTSVSCYINKSITGHGLFYYRVYASDSENNFNSTELRQIFINDTAPNITFIYPNTTNINIAEPDNQTFNITHSDINNDSIIVTWYQNGAIVSNSDNYTFLGSYTTAGYYNITVIINDSSLTDSHSWNLTVNNTDTTPQSVNVTLTSTDYLNRTNGTLQASWKFYDADGDTQTYNETKWYNNSIEVPSLANLTSVASGNTTKSQTWNFSVRVYSGINWSSWYNSPSITIQNAAPEIEPILNISINATEIVNITVNATDIDIDDNLTYSLTSTNNTNFTQTNNIFIWNTTVNDSGTYIVNITVSDNTSNTSQLVTINICEDNDGDGYGDGCLAGSDFNDTDKDKYLGASCSRSCYSSSTYSAAGDCTGGSYTCGGPSSGGGGSSYSGATYTADLETSKYRKSLAKKDKVKFQFKSEYHSATVSVVTINYVDLIIQSAPILVTIYKFKTEKIDIDNDAIYDLSITLNDIIGAKADLTFKLIEEPVIEEIFIEEEIIEENITDEPITEEPTIESFVTENASLIDITSTSLISQESIIYIVLLVTVLLFVILVYVITTKKRLK